MTVKNEELLPLFAEVRQLLEPYQEMFVARRSPRRISGTARADPSRSAERGTGSANQ